MQFKEGTPVYTAKGDKVGSVDRVVVNPHTDEVTHIGVKKGLLFKEDKIVPIEWIEAASADRVTLRDHVTKDDMNNLPPFEETLYVPADYESLADEPANGPAPTLGAARPYYWYPPVGTAWWGYPGARGYVAPVEPPYIVETERNIPDDTVALKEGAKVFTSDDKHVGDVERVFIDEDAGRATHILIAEGLIFKDKKLVPTAWVSSVEDDAVYLSVTSKALDNLPEYAENRA